MSRSPTCSTLPDSLTAVSRFRSMLPPVLNPSSRPVSYPVARLTRTKR